MSAPAIGTKEAFKEALKTLSGKVAFGLLLIIVLMGVATPIYAPYNVVKAWSMREVWMDNPPCAAPAWVQFFVHKKLPKTIIIENEDFHKSVSLMEYAGITYKFIYMNAYFDYPYDAFPNKISSFIIQVTPNASRVSSVRITVELERPDGDRIKLVDGLPVPVNETLELRETTDMVVEAAGNYVRSVTGSAPEKPLPYVVFFAEKGENMNDPKKATVLKGTYKMYVTCVAIGDPKVDVKARMVIYGRVYGLAGTDSYRRDLMIGLLWGAPIALAFGIVAAVVVNLVQTILGVISGYFGGKVDDAVQRVAELMMIIPVLPILILISFIYHIRIWTLLAILVAFGIVGATTKTVRSMVPSIKEEQYILAAKSYGAGSWRIIFKHIFPRVLPYTFSLIATAVPAYIFLEAALSFLGLGDPILPTWGKILGDAEVANAAYYGYWWWIVLPAACIGITAMAFALLGYAFDKVINPRLREM